MLNRFFHSRAQLACALVWTMWFASTFSLSAAGQNLRYLSQQAWSTEEGLPQSSVHSIAQTPDGYLWIATEGGLARFDGINFRIFDRGADPAFRSDDVCCLAVNRDGLWVGTEDGLLLLREGRFRRYATADGLPSSAIEAIHVLPDGSLIAETANGRAVWQKNTFHELAQAPAALASGADGEVKLLGHAPWSFSTTRVSWGLRTWRTGHELPVGRIQAVSIDKEGLAWVGMNNGLYVVKPGDATPVPVMLLSGNSVLSLYEDREGNHWVGTETSGLHVLRRLAFRSESALADQAVTSVAQTRDGSVWVGTRDNGLRRLRNGVIDEPVSENELTSGVILCLAPRSQRSIAIRRHSDRCAPSLEWRQSGG